MRLTAVSATCPDSAYAESRRKRLPREQDVKLLYPSGRIHIKGTEYLDMILFAHSTTESNQQFSPVSSLHAKKSPRCQNQLSSGLQAHKYPCCGMQIQPPSLRLPCAFRRVDLFNNILRPFSHFTVYPSNVFTYDAEGKELQSHKNKQNGK